jgi:uncharacterized protein (DUF58 family)
MHPDPLRFSPLPPKFLFSAAALGMAWSGLRLGNATLLLCGLVLAGVVIGAAFLGAEIRKGLTAGRRHQERVFEEGTAHVELRVENRGWLPVTGVELRDAFPPAESHFVRLMDRRLLWPRSGLRLAYRRVCARHRGVYALGPMQLAAAEPTGLFPFEVDAPVITRLLVYPQSTGLRFFPLLGEGTLTRIGEDILSEPGDSVEFRGVREWRPSDGRRHVHWPTTARTGRLMARELEQDVVTEVTIVMDLRRIALTGLGDHSTLEFAVKAAACIGQTAIERQHLVQLWGLGGQPPSHLPFGAGAEHLTSLLDLLTVIRAEGRGPFARSFERVIPTLRRGATLVLILSAAAFEWDAMEPMLRALALDGVKLVAVVLDDRSFLALFKEQEPLHREAPELAAVIRRLLALGAEVFSAADQEDIRRRLEAPATVPAVTRRNDGEGDE